MTIARADFALPLFMSEIAEQASVQRSRRNSMLVWFTGLSGAGKTTLSRAIEAKLYQRGKQAVVLDGDVIRQGLCRDLGFTEENRAENIRRVGEVSKLLVNAGVLTLAAFISPFEKNRSFVRNLIGTNHFLEIYCKCPLEICESRDVKGLYKKARAGEAPNFVGIDERYEEPKNPELIIDTGSLTVEESTLRIMSLLEEKGLYTF
ncbi:MAG TPA: adenylyl-sulfate kinase [Burkholderiales bacterium]|jgi:adenylylsulfate kinase|nr:adenylyl-sulfate kinase [Burkholderiales bacterium]